jgi:hypothetical protein
MENQGFVGVGSGVRWWMRGMVPLGAALLVACGGVGAPGDESDRIMGTSPWRGFAIGVADASVPVYITCMAHKLATTVRLDPEDAEALARARADGWSASDVIRRGIRIVAAKYYRGRRRPPTTALFISGDPKLGDEAELFVGKDAER